MEHAKKARQRNLIINTHQNPSLVVDKASNMKITEIKSNPNNPRICRDAKFKLLVKSIQEFPEMLGLRPIVIDEHNVILGGNQRYRACIEAGLMDVPVIHANNLTEEQKKQFIVRDNVSTGDWDFDLLANEWSIQDLDNWGLDIPVFANNDIEEPKDNAKGGKTCPNCGVPL